MATPIKDLTELSKAYKGYTVLRFNQEIEQLTEKLEYLNIKIVKELNPCPGEDEQVVRVFECTKDNEDVLVDFFTKDNHIDAYYESSDESIFEGNIQSLNMGSIK